MPSPSDVVIADRLSAANQVRIVGASGLSVSWELSRAGQLAFELPTTDLLKYGLHPKRLLSKWVFYEHPTAGPWGGIITNVSASNGIYAIGAESWAAALRGVVTRPYASVDYPLVSQLMQQIDTVKALTGILPGTVDVGAGGDLPVTQEPVEPGQDLYDVFLPSVLERWNATRGWQPTLQPAGWNVDPVTRRLSFDASYGEDRTREVAIRAGRHIVSDDFSDDLTDLINTVVIKGKTNYTWSETVWFLSSQGKLRSRQITHVGTRDETVFANNQPSVHTYGEKAILLNQDYPSAEMMQAGAQLQAQWMTLNTQNLSIETADVEGLWRGFREGDKISVMLGMEGLYGQMVVRMRALDVSRGVMTVAGEAVLV